MAVSGATARWAGAIVVSALLLGACTGNDPGADGSAEGDPADGSTGGDVAGPAAAGETSVGDGLDDGGSGEGTSSVAGEDAFGADPSAEPPPEPVIDRLLTLTDSAETSQRATDSGESPIQVYDRFLLDQPTDVSLIRWEGLYCRLVEGGPAPDPTATSFLVSIRGDVGDRPDQETAVAEFVVELSAAGQRLRADADRPCGAVSTTVGYYGYEATVDPAVSLDGDRAYWLSIQAVTPDFGTYWAWRGAAGGDETSIRYYQDEEVEVFGDRAFALLGLG